MSDRSVRTSINRLCEQLVGSRRWGQVFDCPPATGFPLGRCLCLVQRDGEDTSHRRDEAPRSTIYEIYEYLQVNLAGSTK